VDPSAETGSPGTDCAPEAALRTLQGHRQTDRIDKGGYFLCRAKIPQNDFNGRTCPRKLRVTIHSALEPKYEEFQPRTIWSLSNAFTSAFKELNPIPQFRATAKLGEFLEAQFSQPF
jgi:hypothetical protein